MKNRKIAIVGTGISGLVCGYHLAKKEYDITLYEAADYIGGHTSTSEVEHNGETSRIDTGFIVFNDRTYPNFIRLLQEIGVDFQPTEMSFSVRNDQLNLEYNGNNINSFFAQRSNLLRPQFWRMLRDIVRFNKDVRAVAESEGNLTIGQYLQPGTGLSEVKKYYTIPEFDELKEDALEMGFSHVFSGPLVRSSYHA